MINPSIYQTIFDEITAFINEKWERIVIYLEYGRTSYSFAFYVKESGKYTKCYSLKDVDEDKLMDAFRRIDKQVSEERESEKATWTNMTMVVDSTLNMKTDFDYTDLSENAYEYSNNWKKQYLV